MGLERLDVRDHCCERASTRMSDSALQATGAGQAGRANQGRARGEEQDGRGLSCSVRRWQWRTIRLHDEQNAEALCDTLAHGVEAVS